jgi:hypothetical protein
MANAKISALTSASTPLTGAETLPVVQSSTTKQVSVANLTAGRSVNVGSLTSSGDIATNSAANFGYITGAGGAVTQATSKTTAVTLNKPTGQITMNNAALAAGASATFTLNNSLIVYTDSIIVNIDGFSILGTAVDKYTVAISPITGGAYIRVTNISIGSLSEDLRINFSLIKGVIA